MGAQWKAKGKAQVADAKGKLFGKLVKEITVAARGGADPASNARLRLVVEQARKVSMPKDTLERAIKKGSGTGADAVNYERVIYEGFAPHQVAVMVECLTDNVNRTAPEMRVLFWHRYFLRRESAQTLLALYGVASTVAGVAARQPFVALTGPLCVVPFAWRHRPYTWRRRDAIVDAAGGAAFDVAIELGLLWGSIRERTLLL